MIKQYAYTLLMGLVLSATSLHTLGDNFYTYSDVTDPGYGDDFDTTDEMLDELDKITSLTVASTSVWDWKADSYKKSRNIKVNYREGGAFNLNPNRTNVLRTINSDVYVTSLTVYSRDNVGVIGMKFYFSDGLSKHWGENNSNWEEFVDEEVTYEIDSGETLVGFHGFNDADNEQILSIGIVTVEENNISHIDYMKVEDDELKIGVHFREDRATSGKVCYVITRIEGLMETEIDYDTYDVDSSLTDADAPQLATWQTLVEYPDYTDATTFYTTCDDAPGVGPIYAILRYEVAAPSLADNGLWEVSIPSGDAVLGNKLLGDMKTGVVLEDLNGKPVDPDEDFPLEALAVTVTVIKTAGGAGDYQYYEQHKETLEYEADYEDNSDLIFPGDAEMSQSIPLAYTLEPDTGRVACLTDLTNEECLWVELGNGAGEVPENLAGVSDKHFIECSTDADFIEKENYSNVDPATTSWCDPIDRHSRFWFSLESLTGEGWIVSANPQTGVIECLMDEDDLCINLADTRGTDYLGTDTIGDQPFLDMTLGTKTITAPFNIDSRCDYANNQWHSVCPDDYQTEDEIKSATFGD
ncbi:MAG: hypothetical protein V7785_21235 [Bermanella sp.]